MEKAKKDVLITYLKAICFASLAAQPSSLFLLWYEGSVIRFLGWVWTVVFVQVFAIIGCVVVGLPVHLLLKKFNQNSKLDYVFAGFSAPLLILASGPIVVMDWDELINLNNITNAMPFAVAGAAAAFVLHHFLTDK